MLSQSKERLRDLIFLDIALDSAVRTAVERGYEELSNASPEVCFAKFFTFIYVIHLYSGTCINLYMFFHAMASSFLDYIHLQKIMYFISLVVENLALSVDDNEDLIYCLKVRLNKTYTSLLLLFFLFLPSHISSFIFCLQGMESSFEHVEVQR